MINDIGQWMGSLNIPVWSELFTTYADRNALYYFFYFALGRRPVYTMTLGKMDSKGTAGHMAGLRIFVRMDAHASRP